MTLAAGLWFAAGVLYLATEAAAAFAFSPAYSYRFDYISDLGVPVCGTVYQGVAICSPWHALMNGDFVVQGLLFLAAAVAVSRAIRTPARAAFLACAALNCVGNGLVGLFPETDPAQVAGVVRIHVLGAFLAIVFGNATALLSAWTLRELRLGRLHRTLSIALPIVAALALALLAGGPAATGALGHGVFERISVYTITFWQLLSAACVMWEIRRR